MKSHNKTKAQLTVELAKALQRVSDLEQLEHDRVQATANLSSLINNKSDSIWSIDTNYDYIVCNDFFKAAYFATYGKEIKTGMNSLEILSEELKSFWQHKYDAALQGEKLSFEFPEEIQGELHYYEVHLNPIIIDKAIVGVTALGIDITKRLQAEEASRESEQRYRLLFKYSPIPLWEQDYTEIIKHLDDLKQSGVSDFEEYFSKYPEELIKCASLIKMKDVNDEAVRLFDANSKDNLMKTIGNVFTEETLPVFKESLMSIAKGKKSFESEVVLQTLKNKRIICLLKWSDSGATIITSTQDITERKRAEDALSHTHDLMRYVIEHSRSAVAVHDRNLNYIYVSQHYLQEYNVKEHDVIGKHHYDVFPDLPQKWRDVHQKALAGEISSAEDDPYLREDGTADWTRWECRPWYEADGSIGGIIVYTEIITERKEAENQLRESEERYRTLFERSSDAIFIVNGRTGQYINANRAAERLTGFSLSEIKTKTTKDLIPEGSEERLDLSVRLGTTRELGEIKYLRADGTERIAILTVVPIKGEHVVGIARDITESKRAEKLLRESEEKFRVLYNHSPDMYVSVSPDDTSILLCNETLLDETGYLREEVIGSPIFKMYHDDCMDDVKRAFQQFVETGKIQDSELILKRKDGSKIDVSLNVDAVKDDAGKILFSISSWRDITERKEAEEALKKAHDTLEVRVRQRTDELRTLVNAMAGREIRMAELKKVTKTLRKQLGEAGLKPVADDPLLPAEDGY